MRCLPSRGRQRPAVASRALAVVLAWAVVLGSTLAGAWPAQAAPGLGVDPEFVTNAAGIAAGAVSKVVVQDDGKILLAGAGVRTPGGGQGIARLNPDGTPDTAFNDNVGTGTSTGNVDVLKVQDDGKILLGGAFSTFNGANVRFLVRLNADGTLDTALGTGLAATYPISSIHDAAAQSDGKVVVSLFQGSSGLGYGGLMRLNADGTADPTFAPGPGLSPASTPSGHVFSLLVQDDGQILIAGSFSTTAGAPATRLARLNPDGSSDAAFNSGISGLMASIPVIALADDGKILVAGGYVAGQYLVRVNADGSRDTGFNTNLGTALGSSVAAIDVQDDGKILVGGSFTTVQGAETGRVARVEADGTPDAVFNRTVGPGFGSMVNAVAAQADGGVLAGGSFTSFRGAPARYLARLIAVTVVVDPVADQLSGVGASVSVPVTASVSSGGGVLSFAATGLPPGVTIDPVSGVISGTVTTPGDYTVEVTATDPVSGASESTSFAWSVVAVSVDVLPDRTDVQGTTVSVPVIAAATDGGALTYGATGLPAGVMIDPATGVMGGTAAPVGVFPVTVTATHPASGVSASESFTWTVQAATVVVTDPGDRIDPAGVGVSVPVVAVTNAGPLEFTATGLPPGLVIDPASGVVTGTPTTGGVFTVGVSATDPGSGVSDGASFTWTIVAVTVTSPGDQTGLVGIPVDLSVTIDTTPTVPVDVTATGLPDGLVIDPATGQVTGTPTTVGVFPVTVTATHTVTGAADTAAFTWTIGVVVVDLTNPGDQLDGVDATVDLALVATASAPGTLSFAATGLPAGLNLNTSTGQVTGTTTTPGVSTVTVTATHDPSGASATQAFTWTVVAVDVTDPGDQAGPAGVGLTLPVAATASNADPVAFTETGLPPGLGIDPVTGQVTGTPTTGGVFAVTVTATHPATGAHDTAAFSWTIVAVTVTNPGDQTGLVGIGVDLPVNVTTTPTVPVVVTATGVPDGLSIDPTTGQVTGTPTVVGVFPVTVTATHTATGATSTIAFSWTITAVLVDLADPGHQLDALGASVDLTLAATASAPGTVSFAATGLPAGLSLDPATGQVTGTTTTPGASTVTVTATHDPSAASATRTFTWTVVAVDITNPGDQVQAAGTPVTLPVVAVASDGDPVAFTATGLPDGLSLDAASGVITGTPTAGGPSMVTVTATHPASGAADSVTFTWTVVQVTVADPGDRADAVGSDVSLQVVGTASNGAAVGFDASGLPDGLDIDTTTGQVTGTPTTLGAFAVLVTVTEPVTGAATSVTFVWTIEELAAAPVTVTLSDPGDQASTTEDMVDLRLQATASDGSPIIFAARGLPPGLSIDSATGAITGTPTRAGTYLVDATAQVAPPSDVAVPAAFVAGADVPTTAARVPIAALTAAAGLTLVVAAADPAAEAAATVAFTWTVTTAAGTGGGSDDAGAGGTGKASTVGGALARTGITVAEIAVGALVLIAAGGAVIAVRRRHDGR